MSTDYGVFEASSTDGHEEEQRQRQATRDLGRAIEAAREGFGDFLSGATDKQDYRDRLALVMNDLMQKVADSGVMPVPGVMRKVKAALRPEFKVAGEYNYNQIDGTDLVRSLQVGDTVSTDFGKYELTNERPPTYPDTRSFDTQQVGGGSSGSMNFSLPEGVTASRKQAGVDSDANRFVLYLKSIGYTMPKDAGYPGEGGTLDDELYGYFRGNRAKVAEVTKFLQEKWDFYAYGIDASRKQAAEWSKQGDFQYIEWDINHEANVWLDEGEWAWEFYEYGERVEEGWESSESEAKAAVEGVAGEYGVIERTYSRKQAAEPSVETPYGTLVLDSPVIMLDDEDMEDVGTMDLSNPQAILESYADYLDQAPPVTFPEFYRGASRKQASDAYQYNSRRKQAWQSAGDLIEQAADDYEADTGRDVFTSPDFLTQYLPRWADTKARNIDYDELVAAAHLEGFGGYTASRKQANEYEIDFDDAGVYRFLHSLEFIDGDGLDDSLGEEDLWDSIKSEVDFDRVMDLIDDAYQSDELSKTQADRLMDDLRRSSGFYANRKQALETFNVDGTEYQVGFDNQRREILAGTMPDGSEVRGYKTAFGTWVAYRSGEIGWSDLPPQPTPEDAVRKMNERNPDHMRSASRKRAFSEQLGVHLTEVFESGEAGGGWRPITGERLDWEKGDLEFYGGSGFFRDWSLEVDGDEEEVEVFSFSTTEDLAVIDAAWDAVDYANESRTSSRKVALEVDGSWEEELPGIGYASCTPKAGGGFELYMWSDSKQSEALDVVGTSEEARRIWKEWRGSDTPPAGNAFNTDDNYFLGHVKSV